MDSMIAYRDMKNNCWWECDGKDCISRPFGHYVFTTLNTCAALLQGKEKFLTNEYYYQSHVKNTNYARAIGWIDETTGDISKEKMSDYYDECISQNKKMESYKPEYFLLCEYLRNIDGFRNGENADKTLFDIYSHFKYFATVICSDIHEYMPAGKERNDFFDNIYDELLIYKGGCFLGSKNNIKELTPVEQFEFTEMVNIFILDFWEFLFNPVYKKAKILFCPNCNSMFASNNNKAKYCEVCRQPEIMGKIRYANRKANKARKLHHDIATLAYSLNTKENDISNSFLNESNYYWDIVQNKSPEKVKEYSAKIKTEADYMKWLEKKYEEIKAKK